MDTLFRQIRTDFGSSILSNLILDIDRIEKVARPLQYEYKRAISAVKVSDPQGRFVIHLWLRRDDDSDDDAPYSISYQTRQGEVVTHFDHIERVRKYLQEKLGLN